jgi:quercetin dioxygenase-like cupin family protein
MNSKPTIVALAAIGLLSVAVQSQNVATPADLKWIDDPNRPGLQAATLAGDPTKAGPYTRRFRLPPRMTLPPHWHPEDRQVTTLSGTWYVGHGAVLDRSRAAKVVPGSFLVQPAKSVHYEFTGDEEVIVQVSGVGPTATEYVK